MARNRQLANLPDAITTDTSNNVGIGGSPSGTYKFEVTGYGRFNNASGMALQANGGAFTQATASSYSLGIGNTGGSDLTLGTSTTAGVIQTWSSKPLSLNPQGNNVLIGSTTDSSYKLDVTGTVRFSSTLLVSGAATFSSTIAATSGTFIVDDAATNSVLDILTLTHTTSGTAASGLGAGILFRTERPSGGITLSRGAIYGVSGTDANDDGDLAFYTLTDTGGSGFSEKMRIYANGRIENFNVAANNFALTINGSATTGQSYGINIYAGTNSSDAAFNVNNSVSTNLFKVRGDGAVILQSFSAASTSGNLLFNYSTATADSRSWRFANDTAEWGDISIQVSSSQTSTSYTTKFNISRQGNVGLSRTPVTNTLEVNGDASKTTAGSWLANSDINIKTDINTIEDALDRINKVRLVKFKYKDAYKEANNGIKDKFYHNVIAQEFQEIYPDYVYDSGDVFEENNVLQVDTNPMYIDSVSAIQELSKMVIDLQNQINELKNK